MENWVHIELKKEKCRSRYIKWRLLWQIQDFSNMVPGAPDLKDAAIFSKKKPKKMCPQYQSIWAIDTARFMFTEIISCPTLLILCQKHLNRWCKNSITVKFPCCLCPKCANHPPPTTSHPTTAAQLWPREKVVIYSYETCFEMYSKCCSKNSPKYQFYNNWEQSYLHGHRYHDNQHKAVTMGTQVMVVFWSVQIGAVVRVNSI